MREIPAGLLILLTQTGRRTASPSLPLSHRVSSAGDDIALHGGNQTVRRFHATIALEGVER